MKQRSWKGNHGQSILLAGSASDAGFKTIEAVGM